jgi:MFS family permease
LNKRTYAVLLACFFTVLISYAIRYSYGMLLPEMLPGLGITKTEAGAVFALYFVAYTLCTPILGLMSDLYNYRMILTVFAFVLGGGALMMASAASHIEASLAFAVVGIGHAACWAPVAALVQKWVPDHRRGMAMSFVSMGIGTGVLIWSLLLPPIVAHWSWRAGWLSLGVCGLGAALLNLILIRNPKKAKRLVSQGVTSVRTFYRELLRSKKFWLIGCAYLLMGFNTLVLFAFLPVYARESLDFSYAASTRLVSFIGVFGIAGQLLLGALSDLGGRVKVMIICAACMGMACLGMLFFRSPWALYALTGLFGFGYGAVWPVYAAAAADYFPQNNTGGVVGLWTVLLGLGSIVSPLVCGWTIDKTGSYNWTFALGLFSALISVLLLLMLIPQGRRQFSSY